MTVINTINQFVFEWEGEKKKKTKTEMKRVHISCCCCLPARGRKKPIRTGNMRLYEEVDEILLCSFEELIKQRHTGNRL